MKRRDNNRGFTLVELVIAVAILAIAILPLFSNFVQSAKMNLKGRKNLNAMNLAQDMMEGMSAYKGQEIDNVIRAAGSDTTKLAGTILPKAAKCSSITVKTGAEWAYADATATKPDITKPFGYVFKDVETVVNETHNKYDVELILDPTGTDQEKYNNREVTGDMDVNQFYDAVFTMPINEVEEAVSGLYNMSDKSVDKNDYYGKIRRNTIVSVFNSGTETEPNYRVSVRREYRPLNPVALGLSGSIVWYDEAVNISKLEANKLPRSVYFYFEGMQNANKTDKIHENIQILNKTGQDINIYLLRTQKVDSVTGEPLGGPDAKAYNDSFGCSVVIKSENMSGAATENVNIVSNLRYDLSPEANEYNIRLKDENGNNTVAERKGTLFESDPPPAGVSSCYDNNRVFYFYNGSAVDEAMYQKHFEAGYPKSKKNAIYKVIINLYEPGTTKKVASYDGGVSN